MLVLALVLPLLLLLVSMLVVVLVLMLTLALVVVLVHSSRALIIPWFRGGSASGICWLHTGHLLLMPRARHPLQKEWPQGKTGGRRGARPSL